ncbi:MAG: NAD(+) synthase [candidate division WOR-3 bacterium]|nr:NAD(+) synthase [candidate division WOR-3 bacterium]
MEKEKIIEELKIKPEVVFLSLINFIKNCCENFRKDGIILGLSGGIDSSLTTFLCKEAIGEKRVLALILPEIGSNQENLKDAIQFAQRLNIKYKVIEITKYLKNFGIYDLFFLNNLIIPQKIKPLVIKKLSQLYQKKTQQTPFLSILEENKKLNKFIRKIKTYYRFKHRLRMILLYLFADLENRLVVGTTNKTEYLIGFFVKYGCDDACDVMPLLSLYKTQVRELYKYLGLPKKILEKKPSPDLLPGIFDEEVIGLNYEELDLILYCLEKGLSVLQIANILKIDKEKIEYVSLLIKKSDYYRCKSVSYGNYN